MEVASALDNANNANASVLFRVMSSECLKSLLCFLLIVALFLWRLAMQPCKLKLA